MIVINELNNKHNEVYKTIILPVVLYGCETSFLALIDEHRLGMFENRGNIWAQAG
jgi:hypothetical protein